MNDKHTQTPWAFKESNGRYISNEPFELDSDEFGTTSSAILGADGKVVCIVPEAHNGQWAEGERDRNISHIVKCVNNHERLVEALKWCLGQEQWSSMPYDGAKQIERVLNKLDT